MRFIYVSLIDKTSTREGYGHIATTQILLLMTICIYTHAIYHGMCMYTYIWMCVCIHLWFNRFADYSAFI